MGHADRQLNRNSVKAWVMLLLPPITKLPQAPFGRRHMPPRMKRDYTLYRNCLRWDFGFTCATCLLHERDLANYGTEGLGVTQIEHFQPQSLEPSRITDYSNLLYICRFCNGARSDCEVVDPQTGHRLLDPSLEIWAAHFTIVNDEILPNNGDGDAEYTAYTYDINDLRKVALRRRRRETLERVLGLLVVGAAQLSTTFIKDTIHHLKIELLDYRCIPDDAPGSCRCNGATTLALPPVLACQMVDITALL